MTSEIRLHAQMDPQQKEKSITNNKTTTTTAKGNQILHKVGALLPGKHPSPSPSPYPQALLLPLPLPPFSISLRSTEQPQSINNVNESHWNHRFFLREWVSTHIVLFFGVTEKAQIISLLSIFLYIYLGGRGEIFVFLLFSLYIYHYYNFYHYYPYYFWEEEGYTDFSFIPITLYT